VSGVVVMRGWSCTSAATRCWGCSFVLQFECLRKTRGAQAFRSSWPGHARMAELRLRLFPGEAGGEKPLLCCGSKALSNV
jgi:hypothetical protein